MAHPLTYASLIARMADLGAHLLALRSGEKAPSSRQWTLAHALSPGEALEHLNRGGNIGVNLLASRLVVLDAENEAATAALMHADCIPTVIPAKSTLARSPKRGGMHFWLRLPDGIDAMDLKSDLQLRLPSGGLVDVLAGPRQAVAPPSQLAEAGGLRYMPAVGGALDPSAPAELQEAPSWIFSEMTGDDGGTAAPVAS